MANAWSQFKALTGESPLQVGKIIAHLEGGLSRVELPSGGVIDARGQSVVVGKRAFIRGGVVEGAAPELSTIEVEI